MRTTIIGAAFGLALLGGAASAQTSKTDTPPTPTTSPASAKGPQAPVVRSYIAAAIADAHRPAEDVAKDAARKPGAMMTFAGVKPGDTVVDFIPGAGYFTRVFSGVVGPTGHVYALVPDTIAKLEPKVLTGMQALAADPAYANVTVVTSWAAIPAKADIVWTAQNYHDIHAFLPGQIGAVNKVVYGALKPGGEYVVIDHVSAPGTGDTVSKTLHRIEPGVVKSEVTAAGFTFDGETKVLANPADPHSLIVFDPAIRGHTDQFAYKFKKAAS